MPAAPLPAFLCLSEKQEAHPFFPNHKRQETAPVTELQAPPGINPLPAFNDTPFLIPVQAPFPASAFPAAAMTGFPGFFLSLYLQSRFFSSPNHMFRHAQNSAAGAVFPSQIWNRS